MLVAVVIDVVAGIPILGVVAVVVTYSLKLVVVVVTSDIHTVYT